MKPGIKTVSVATIFLVSSSMAALAQADVSVGASGGASTAAGDAGAAASASANAGASGNAGANAASTASGHSGASDNTYGRLIAGLRTGTLAETDEFTEYEVGTDGEVEILALVGLQGEGAENGIQALENAIAATGIDADYSQLPEGAFDDTDFDEDDVVAAYFDADGNLVIVVDGSS